jgi:hypothetical protein
VRRLNKIPSEQGTVNQNLKNKERYFFEAENRLAMPPRTAVSVSLGGFIGDKNLYAAMAQGASC